MAKRILVPLDGAPSSEAVLSLVGAIARSAGSTVRLLHVDPVPDNVEHENGRVIAYADQELSLALEGTGPIDLSGVPFDDVRYNGIPVANWIVRRAMLLLGADPIVNGAYNRHR